MRIEISYKVSCLRMFGFYPSEIIFDPVMRRLKFVKDHRVYLDVDDREFEAMTDVYMEGLRA